MVSLQDVSKIGEISAGVRAFWLKWGKIGRYKLQNSCVESLNIKYMWVNKFSGLAAPGKRVFGPARKSGSLLVSIPIALLERVKCPLASRKSTVTLHTAAACSCRPKTFSCGEHRLQTPGSGSNVFRSRHSSYNLSAKKSLPQTLNLHL